MKRQLARLGVFAILLLVLAACSHGRAKDIAARLADALTDALDIDGGSEQDGPPPSSSNAPDAPVIKATAGSELRLGAPFVFTLYSDYPGDDVDRAILYVEKAKRYFIVYGALANGRFDIAGLLGTDDELRGKAFNFKFALGTSKGLIGPYWTYNRQILDMAPSGEGRTITAILADGEDSHDSGRPAGSTAQSAPQIVSLDGPAQLAAGSSLAITITTSYGASARKAAASAIDGVILTTPANSAYKEIPVSATNGVVTIRASLAPDLKIGDWFVFMLALRAGNVVGGYRPYLLRIVAASDGDRDEDVETEVERESEPENDGDVETESEDERDLEHEADAEIEHETEVATELEIEREAEIGNEGDEAVFPTCAIPNAGPDQTVDRLVTIVLDGTASSDPNETVQGYKWVFLSKPFGVTNAFLVDGNGSAVEGVYTTEAHPKFFAERAGEYVIGLTLKDSDSGCSGSISDTVTITVPPIAISLELVWDAPGNDQDLHLIRPGGAFSRSDDSNQDDCHYANCRTQCVTPNHPERCNGPTYCPTRGCPGPTKAPDWGTIGVRSDDPTLDQDDIQTTGPELINFASPTPGEYLVAVANFNGSTPSMTSTVRVWLFGQLAGTFLYPPAGSSSPYFDSCTHWNVATIKVTDSSTIEVVPITTKVLETEENGCIPIAADGDADRDTTEADTLSNLCPIAHITVLGASDLGAIRQYDTLTLSAASSYDPDAGDSIARYEWSILSKPATSNAAFSSTTVAEPTLSPDLPGDYRLGLTVYDQKNMVSCMAAELVFTAQQAVPSLSCTPLNHDFGAKDIGSSSAFSFVCSNEGKAALHISQVELIQDASQVYSISSALNTQLEVGASSFMEVTYTPTTGGVVAGIARIHSDDPKNPTYDLGLRGGSAQPNTCPVASFIVTSPSLNDIHLYDTVHFDASASSDPDSGDTVTMYSWEIISKPQGSRTEVSPYGSATPSLTVDVVGTYKIQLLVKDGYNTFSCSAATVEFTAKEAPPNLSCTPLVLNFGTLAIGQSLTQGVTCTNTGLGPLTFSSVTVTSSTPDVFLLANTPATTLSANESTVIAVSYTATAAENDSGSLHILSNDPNSAQLAVPLIGNNTDPNVCPMAVLSILSPDPSLLKPLDTVQLDAGGSTDPDAGDGIGEYIYTVLARPDGSTSRIVPQAGNNALASFIVDMAGDYTIQLQIRDTRGVLSCNKAVVELKAVPREKIHVELTWSTPEGDFDVHLVKPGSAIWSADCSPSNKTPNWVAFGNPTFAFDDKHGYGPEEIDLDNPGSGVYGVYVHYYDSWGEHSPATVTLHIYVKAVLAGSYQITWPESREHYRWAAATITWDATQSTGTVSPVSTSLEADGSGG